jgi:hypothetical protein
MKKSAALLVLLSLNAFMVQAQERTFEARDLTNVISRSISIQSLFAKRWDALPAESRNGYVSAHFDGTWYVGFNISTDFGVRSADLGRLYGDALLVFPTSETVSIGLGLAGFRYGVFITGLSLGTPSDDPFGGESVGVTDFAGDQFFDDLVKLSIAHRDWGQASVDVLINRVIEPNRGVVAGIQPKEIRFNFGFNLEALRIFYINSLYVATNTQSGLASLKVRADVIEALRRFGIVDLKQLLDGAFFGIQDRFYPYLNTLNTVSALTRAFTFDAELRSANLFGQDDRDRYLSIGGRLGIYSPSLINDFKRILNYANLRLFFRSGNEQGWYFGLEVQPSLYDDARLPLYGSRSTTTLGISTNVIIGLSWFRAELGYALNHLETLQYIAEAYGNNTFRIVLKLGN